MARTLVKILEGQAALDELIAWKMPDWQAKKVLSDALKYDETTFPVEGGYSTLTVEHKDGHYHVGGYYRGSRWRP